MRHPGREEGPSRGPRLDRQLGVGQPNGRFDAEIDQRLAVTESLRRSLEEARNREVGLVEALDRHSLTYVPPQI